MSERRVLPFVVPPVVKTVTVSQSPAEAFARFTGDIARWWPLARLSVGGEDAVLVAFEPFPGGRLVERDRDGSEHTWGTVLTWEEPDEVAFTWHAGREPDLAQTVTVSFAAVDSGTLVRLVHAGWERLGDQAPALREEYDGGWVGVMAGYAAYVEETA